MEEDDRVDDGSGCDDCVYCSSSDYDPEDNQGSDCDLEDGDDRQIGCHPQEEQQDQEGGSYGQHDYAIVSEAEIRAGQEEEVSGVCSVLSVSRTWACALLVHYNWNVGKLQDAWFTDDEAVRNAVGLLEGGSSGAVGPAEKASYCRICLEESPCDRMSAAPCGHLFCNECWERYVHVAVADGPGCLLLRCPDPACRVIVTQDMVDRFATGEDREKYSLHLFRSYVGSRKRLKWCPAPDCQFTVELMGRETYGVCCKCSYYFCCNCGEEAHRPLDCDMVAKWVLKNSSEAESTNWILSYCKPCPKCHRMIDKNEGCMHMTCREPCRHQFCWLCLGDWAQHGTTTGGFYACNVYQQAKESGILNEEEMKKESARRSLERYTHYYERWAANHTSRQKALRKLERLDEQVEWLKDKYSQPHGQLKFIQEAWLQIAECRRVLKWSYVYGYYLPENEYKKKDLFEYLQGEAEAQLDILHSSAEKDMDVFLDDITNPLLREFIDYRSNLAGRTSVVRRYFENLVRSLESGLKDVPAGNEEGDVSYSSGSESM